MKKILSFLYAIFLLHSACAVPVETDVSNRGLLDGIINTIWGGASAITDFGLNIFSNVMQNVQTLVNTTVSGAASLANNSLQALSNTTQKAIDVFKNAASIPASIGTKIKDGLNNRSPGSGAATINDNLNNLVANAGASVDMAATVGVNVGSIKQDLSTLTTAVKGVSDTLAAAAKAATSGFNAFFSTNLMNVLGDPALKAIQEAVKMGVGIINNATTAFVAAVENNPFRTFVNDVLVANTKDMAASALAALQKAVSQLISDATKALNDTATAKVAFINQFVPGAIADIEKLVSQANSTIATSLAAAKTLSAETQAAIQADVQAAVTNVTGLVKGLKEKLVYGVQAITGTILSETQETITNVTGLAKNVTQQVVTNLIAAKLQARDAAISTLTKLVTVATDALKGVKKCVENEAANVQTNVKNMLSGFQSAAALINTNVQTCLSLTSKSEIAACFQVSFKTLKCVVFEIIFIFLVG